MHPGAQIFPIQVSGGASKSNEGRTAFVDAGTSKTASAVAIGTADPNRRVVVCIGSRQDSGSGAAYVSFTIGGVSGEIHQQTTTNSNSRCIMLGSAIVPTGIEADVVINNSRTVRSGGGIWVAAHALYNCSHIQSVDDQQNTGGDGNLSAALTGVGAGNYLIGVSQYQSSSVDISGAGLGDNSQINGSEENIEVANNFNAAGGSMTATTTNAYGLILAEFG